MDLHHTDLRRLHCRLLVKPETLRGSGYDPDGRGILVYLAGSLYGDGVGNGYPGIRWYRIVQGESVRCERTVIPRRRRTELSVLYSVFFC